MQGRTEQKWQDGQTARTGAIPSISKLPSRGAEFRTRSERTPGLER